MILINKNFYKSFSLEFEPASQVLMKGAYNVLILPLTTINQLWNRDSKIKCWEVFFEVYPQLVFQLFLLCRFGFGLEYW